MAENMKLQPISPYGVTKLAAEHLCYLYWKNYDIPTISLRYFTVYGPRQRPDMGIYKFVRDIINKNPITIYGDGNQTRDFTYVDDIVNANIKSATSKIVGEVFNIGGGSRITVNELIQIIEKYCNATAIIKYDEKQKGDVPDTLAYIKNTKTQLDWIPKTSIHDGIKYFVSWYNNIR